MLHVSCHHIGVLEWAFITGRLGGCVDGDRWSVGIEQLTACEGGWWELGTARGPRKKNDEARGKNRVGGESCVGRKIFVVTDPQSAVYSAVKSRTLPLGRRIAV